MKRQAAYELYRYAKAKYNILAYPDTQKRADEFQSYGIGSIDSLHLAMAECVDVEVLLTTDDKFIKAAKRVGTSVRVLNPLTWLMEVSDDER